MLRATQKCPETPGSWSPKHKSRESFVLEADVEGSLVSRGTSGRKAKDIRMRGGVGQSLTPDVLGYRVGGDGWTRVKNGMPR